MEYFIADWKLIPGAGGVFEVVVNDELIFSKKQLGRHAEPGEIKRLLQDRIDTFKQGRGLNWDGLPQDKDD
jgi:selenoprotein W-related protein